MVALKFIPAEKMTLPVMQLFSAASEGYVFGGMGSWNDYWYNDKAIEARHNQLSRELYSVINDCYLAIANV